MVIRSLLFTLKDKPKFKDWDKEVIDNVTLDIEFGWFHDIKENGLIHKDGSKHFVLQKKNIDIDACFNVEEEIFFSPLTVYDIVNWNAIEYKHIDDKETPSQILIHNLPAIWHLVFHHYRKTKEAKTDEKNYFDKDSKEWKENKSELLNKWKNHFLKEFWNVLPDNTWLMYLVTDY